MVDGQLLAAWLVATVLARLAVTDEHTSPRTGQTQVAWHTNIARQSDYQGNHKVLGNPVEHALRSFHHFGFFL